MKKVIKYILDIFYPNRCPFCDDFIKWDALACDKCIDTLEYIETCEKCGKTDCMCDKELYYDKAYVLFKYEGIVRESIIALKRKNGINAAEFYADKLSERILKSEEKFDMIVPVPMAKSKKKDVGYNQAFVIADFIAKRLEIPVVDALIKAENTIAQHTLSKEDRIENVKGMFSSGDISLKGKRILLCDDVITTGSTVIECSRLLKEMEAEFLAVALAATTDLRNKSE